MNYKESLHHHLIRYEIMMTLVEKLPLATFTKKELVDFIKLTIEQLDDNPLEKSNRLFGFIQGILIASGLTTVEKERDATRSFFRPLDFPE